MWRTPFCEGLARVYHLLVWGGAGTSVPLVCGDRTFTALPHCNSGDSFACVAFTMFWLRC